MGSIEVKRFSKRGSYTVVLPRERDSVVVSGKRGDFFLRPWRRVEGKFGLVVTDLPIVLPKSLYAARISLGTRTRFARIAKVLVGGDGRTSGGYTEIPPDVTAAIGSAMSGHEMGRLAMPRARHWPAAFSATAGVAVALLAGSCHSSSNPISLDSSSNGRTIVVALGDKIEITLQTIGPGQYETPLVSSASVRFLGESSAGPPNPGGPRQLFRFEAVAPGRAEITIPHTNVDPPPPRIPPFIIVVDVR